MSKGCTKADRNRNSAANAAYKSGNRQSVNRDKRIKRNDKQMEKAAKKWATTKRVARGTARHKRRKALQLAYVGV